MIQQDSNSTWNHSILNNLCDEDINMKVPPPSPQDLSMLETVFSKHLSAKMHSVVVDNTQHAQTLERLLLSGTLKPHQFKRRHHKRPSRIPILSSRIKKRNNSRKDVFINPANKPTLKGFASVIKRKTKKNEMLSAQDTIIQGLKDLNL